MVYTYVASAITPRLSLSPLGVTIKREFTSYSAEEETDGEDSSVTVAVRVRPFSQR